MPEPYDVSIANEAFSILWSCAYTIHIYIFIFFQSKYKPQVKKEPLDQDSKPVQSINKVGSKASGGKNNQIASMFAQQSKKVVKKEKTEDKDELAKPKVP